jgi:hypothetical protein
MFLVIREHQWFQFILTLPWGSQEIETTPLSATLTASNKGKG